MLLISVRDALWRWRRFLVALVATALVLGLTLVLDGVNRSFPNEARRTVAAFGADAWIVPTDTSGVFLSSTVMPSDTAPFESLPGVEQASAVAILRAGLGEAGEDVNVIGVTPGRFTDPPLTEGRVAEAAGELVADSRFDLSVGETTTLDGRPFTVVGLTEGLTFRAGVPSVYVPLADAQAVGYSGAPIVTTVATKGTPETLPDGYQALTNSEVESDLLEPLVNARKTITLVLALLWIVAAMVIGSVVYLTSIDRSRDFAVLKATGATNRTLLGGLALQASLLSGGACVLGIAMSFLLAPALPMHSEVSMASYLTLAVVAVGVAVTASLVSARRTLRIDPALAFAGA